MAKKVGKICRPVSGDADSDVMTHPFNVATVRQRKDFEASATMKSRTIFVDLFRRWLVFGHFGRIVDIVELFVRLFFRHVRADFSAAAAIAISFPISEV